MSKSRQKRWLLVAQRAAEIKALLDRQQLAKATQFSQQAAKARDEAQQVNDQLQQQWRTWHGRESFHAGEDAVFRRYQSTTLGLEAAYRLDAIDASHLLDAAQSQARLAMGEKRALDAAVRRAQGLLVNADERARQHEADEVWQVLDAHGGRSS